jgi:hypothetical protein
LAFGAASGFAMPFGFPVPFGVSMSKPDEGACAGKALPARRRRQ